MNSILMHLKFSLRPRSTRWSSHLVGFGVALILTAAGAQAGQLSQLQMNGKVLKTKPANGSQITPLADALVAYDRAVEANGGKAPADAAQRLQKIQSLAPQAKGEIRSFAQRLTAAGEAADFDAFVEVKAKETGSGKLMSEIRAAGGATKLLLSAGDAIDKDIASRKQASSVASMFFNDLLDLVSVRSAQASLKSGVCSGFWFVITWGYGDRFAYESCYQ